MARPICARKCCAAVPRAQSPTTPIRALRAVRLSVQFDLKIHPATGTDIRQHSSGLCKSSTERVRDEFFKLLRLEKAARGLRVLAHIGILQQILPFGADKAEVLLAVAERMAVVLSAISSRRSDNTAAAFDLGMLVIQLDRFRAGLQAHLARVYGNGREHAQLLVLAAAMHALDDKRDTSRGSRMAEVAKELALTLAEGRRLSLIIGNYRQVVDQPSWSTLDQHRFWHRLGDGGIDAILLAAALVLGEAGSGLRQADWLQFVERVTRLLDTFLQQIRGSGQSAAAVGRARCAGICLELSPVRQ